MPNLVKEYGALEPGKSQAGYVLCCACLGYGEITEWTGGQNKCGECLILPCLFPLLVENQRRLTEAKIHHALGLSGQPNPHFCEALC
jgi:hypothetical protein